MKFTVHSCGCTWSPVDDIYDVPSTLLEMAEISSHILAARKTTEFGCTCSCFQSNLILKSLKRV